MLFRSVSTCAGVEENKTDTYLCRPGHPSNPQSARTEALGLDVDAGGSKSKLQRSAKRRKSRRLTADVPGPRSHTGTFRNVPVGSIGPAIDVATSRLNLEMSVERGTAERLTWDALMRSDRPGNLKSIPEGLINLPLSAGCWGSLGAKTDESRSSASASINREKTKSLTADVPDLRSHL